MPTYEYRCAKGHHFELFQSMTDEPVEKCPECGAKSERLLSSGAGLIFKGSGFYITDYRSDSYKKSAESDGGSKASGGTSGSGGGAASTSTTSSSGSGGE